MRLDASSPDLKRTEAWAERADIFRAAVALLGLREWGEQPKVDDAVYVAKFLAGGQSYE